MVGVRLLNQRFDPSVVLHPVAESVADQADDIVLLERELGLGDSQHGQGGERKATGERYQGSDFHQKGRSK